MSEQEFVDWADSTTLAEWVDGEVIVMSPITSRHDDVQWWLRTLLSLFVESADLGVVKGPEFMVRLSKPPQRRIPDLLFVSKARQKLILPTYLDGAPELIMEVVSPESVGRDWREKYLDYERGGVREYWIIDPTSQRMEAYALSRAKKYQPLVERDDRIRSAVLKGFYLRRQWLFAERLPKVAAALQELGIRF